MKKLLSIVLALCMVLCLCACGNSNDNNTPDEPADAPVADTPADVPADEPADEPADAPADEPAGTVYTVTVTDEGGNPVAGAMVQICQGELCLMPCATDAEGVATFTAAEEGAYEAKLLALPTGYEYATEEQVFHFNGSLELTIVLKAVA